MLAIAGRRADIVALGVAPTTGEAEMAARIAVLRDAAGARFDHLELNINLFSVAGRVPAWMAGRLNGAALEAAGAVSSVGGTVEEMCDQLRARRDHLGISYITVSEDLMEDFAPVAERLAGH